MGAFQEPPARDRMPNPPPEPDPNGRSAAEEALAFWSDGFGLALLLVRDHGRAEELCQEAFLRLVQSRRPLDRTRSLRPLVLTAVRNLCLNELRRKRPESLDAAREAGATRHEPTARHEQDPPERLARSERSSAVHAALAKLSPGWREMVYLRDGLGCSYREIAAVAGKTEDVVRTTLSRARGRLRELLSAHAPEGSAKAASRNQPLPSRSGRESGQGAPPS